MKTGVAPACKGGYDGNMPLRYVLYIYVYIYTYIEELIYNTLYTYIYTYIYICVCTPVYKYESVQLYSYTVYIGYYDDINIYTYSIIFYLNM